MESLRNEKASLVSEFKQAKEECRHSQKELSSVSSSLEASRAQMAHLDTAKESLQGELGRLRDSMSLEIARAERTSESYKDHERRLRDLRADLAREEAAYERAKSRNAEEEARYAQSRRALHVATDELSKIEASVTEANELIHSQRNKAIEEISQLGQLKHSVQQDVLGLSDAKQRQERLSLRGGQQLQRATATLPWAGSVNQVASSSSSSRPPLSATEQQGSLMRDRLQHTVAQEQQGQVPTARVFESPSRVRSQEKEGDVSREMDEAVFRSLQEAQRQQHSTNQHQQQRSSLFDTAVSSSSSTQNNSGAGDINLQDEMRKLREQTSAILK
jgi:hypothetical protein